MALPVKALHVGQEDYWLNQIAKDREEYFSGKGESPGRFVGDLAEGSGLSGEATPEQVRALARGLDPATGQVRCKPLWRRPALQTLGGAAAGRAQAARRRAGGRAAGHPGRVQGAGH